MPLEFSQERANIAKALVLISSKIDKVGKSQVGTVDTDRAHYSYRYADLSAVVDGVSEALREGKVALLQPVDVKYEQNAAFVTVTTWLIHESGEWANSPITMRAARTDPQGVGSALTYARRYGLMSMVGIAPAEDDDGAGASNRGNRPPEARQQQPQQQRPPQPQPQPQTPKLKTEKSSASEKQLTAIATMLGTARINGAEVENQDLRWLTDTALAKVNASYKTVSDLAEADAAHFMNAFQNELRLARERVNAKQTVRPEGALV